MARALIKHRPHALLISGYSCPESLVALAWARYMGRPAVLMSDTQSGDRPRIRWKETLKKMLVRSFDTALVAGPRQCDYLVGLGLPPERIVQGCNAVDNTFYAERSTAFKRDPAGRSGLPVRNYFLAVSRFAPEKNLPCLIRAYATYRRRVSDEHAWDLVLCGDGPEAARIDAVIQENGLSHAIHHPGFLQADELVRWYAFASGFVLPSLIEPWGLVVNEAAACGLPLLISDRAGSAEVLVPRAANTTGRRFDPTDESDLASALAWLSRLPRSEWEGLGGAPRNSWASGASSGSHRVRPEALDRAFTIISYNRSSSPIRHHGQWKPVRMSGGALAATFLKSLRRRPANGLNYRIETFLGRGSEGGSAARGGFGGRERQRLRRGGVPDRPGAAKISGPLPVPPPRPIHAPLDFGGAGKGARGSLLPDVRVRDDDAGGLL